MTKRKKVFYPVAKTSRRPPPPGSDQSPERPNLASINMTAGIGRPGLSVGDRVRIQAAGQFKGEIVTIERLIAGPIPAALVRTASGSSRHARTIDLEPVREGALPGTTTA